MLAPEDIEKCCTTCKYIEYFSCSTDGAYCSGQKDAPHIECPDHYVCDHYKNMLYKTDSPEEKEPADENKMDDFLFKEITVQKRVFNENFWIIGDLYVLEKKLFCLTYIEKDDYAITLWNYDTGHVSISADDLVKNYSTIKHIKKESLVKD